MIILKPNKQSITTAVKILENGGVVVCPTDTVYGFLALAENKKAVEKIFKIKKRSKTKSLPIFVANLRMAHELAEISLEQEKVIKAKWPGKFTFVLKLKNKNMLLEQFHGIVPMVIAKNNTIALRVPKYKFLNDLLKIIGKPLVQTSVNISSEPPINKISEIIKVFGKSKSIDIIVDVGNLKNPKQSRIVDLTGKKEKIIRK